MGAEVPEGLVPRAAQHLSLRRVSWLVGRSVGRLVGLRWLLCSTGFGLVWFGCFCLACFTTFLHVSTSRELRSWLVMRVQKCPPLGASSFPSKHVSAVLKDIPVLSWTSSYISLVALCFFFPDLLTLVVSPFRPPPLSAMSPSLSQGFPERGG